MKKKSFIPGVITIYMSLTLILVSALICVMLESGRVSSVNARLKSITYMACDSVFSGYARQIYDEYGAMMVWCDQNEAVEKLKSYIGENLKTNGLLGISYADLYSAAVDEININEVTKPTDNGGEFFAEQVYDYMQYFLVEDAASYILSNTSIFNQGDKVSDFMDKIEEYEDVFTNVEESVSNIKEKINEAKEVVGKPYETLEKMLDALSEYSQGKESAKNDFNDSLNDLKEVQDKLTQALENIRDETEEYYECVEEAKEAVGNLENELDENRNDMEDEIYDVVNEQVQEIKKKSADTDFDYYLVGANSTVTEEYISQLGTLDGLFEDVDYDLDEENVERYTGIVDYYKNDFCEFNIDKLEVNFDSEEVATEDDGFLSTVSELFDEGLLGFVAGDVSDKSIDKSDLPSVTAVSNSSENQENILEATANKALFGEYILQHFGNCKETRNGALDYQVEYIIAGKDSDSANLSQVVADIVLIRSGLNMISLLKSSTKKSETLALATAIVGFTGMPIVVKIFQILVMAAWALAESIADVKALIEGKKVKVLKDDSDWYISIAGLKNFGNEAIVTSDCEKGLTYESYLRILLLVQNTTMQRYRTMDMIQANVCKEICADFRVADCLVGIDLSVDYSVPQFFSGFSVVKSVIETSDGTFTIRENQSYMY